MANKVVLSKTDFLAWLEDAGACEAAKYFVENQKDQDAEGIFNTAKKHPFGENWLHWLGHRLPDNEVCYPDDGLQWSKVLEALGVK